MNTYHAIEWLAEGKLRLIDQRRLPQELVYCDYTDYHEVALAIRDMVVRGAPAIGITAGYGMALAALYSPATDVEALRADLCAADAVLRAARPTAVNLFWALERVLRRAADPTLPTVAAIREAVLAEAHAIYAFEAESNFRIGQNALPLVPDGAKIIHHCNTGPLATGEYGTALRVITAAHEAGKRVFAYVDETRPRLQGARLTAWELQQWGVPFTIIVDGAAAHIMRTVGIDLCVVGCDRIAANGDTANKIGTYSLALAAKAHNVPFYVVGPTSTIDMTLASGDDIVIEQRPAEEITRFEACQIAPADASATNPAFDVTPAAYITAIITERGVIYPPFKENLARLMA
ncbi:MAG TPA: S-methyl-5-thioribose-1-phosphate isomerase [Anaerolineae bacterium]|nr:S-methyl-5-thioribose-1-phosphate isomerase [Anaerolineae bacterium]HQK14316.1 S-methyl-5-thioribose-1-phosphate isomerase [Anaerolineae bacterium]